MCLFSPRARSHVPRSNCHSRASSHSCSGHSSGGRAAVEVAASADAQHYFAALVPVAMANTSSPLTATELRQQAERLLHLPTWAYHARDDIVADPASAVALIQALRVLGATKDEAKITLFRSAPPPACSPQQTGHDSAALAYARPELYSWLLAQRSAAVPPSLPGHAGVASRMAVRKRSSQQALVAEERPPADCGRHRMG